MLSYYLNFILIKKTICVIQLFLILFGCFIVFSCGKTENDSPDTETDIVDTAEQTEDRFPRDSILVDNLAKPTYPDLFFCAKNIYFGKLNKVTKNEKPTDGSKIRELYTPEFEVKFVLKGDYSQGDLVEVSGLYLQYAKKTLANDNFSFTDVDYEAYIGNYFFVSEGLDPQYTKENYPKTYNIDYKEMQWISGSTVN